jgi:hypothetical protein
MSSFENTRRASFILSLAACAFASCQSNLGCESADSHARSTPREPEAPRELQAMNQARSEPVIVNGETLGARELDRFAAQCGMRIPPGKFWYDRTSGAWGLEGGATAGFTRAGLDLGGPLRADASGGGSGAFTGVFINGREIHPLDVMGLSRLGQVWPGRYWVDAYGNFGFEGAPALGNFVALAQQARAGSSSYLKRTQAGYIGGDGDTSYFFDPQSGASVIPGEGVSY